MTFYNRLQLIAYQVPTDRPYRENQVIPEERRLPAGPVCEIRSQRLAGLENQLTAGLSRDALSRLKRMIAVAERASASLAIDPVPNTLKVFMAPEFYFRPEVKGATSWSYTEAEKDLILQALEAVFSDDKYASWLFIFGTIVWHETVSNLVSKVPDLPNPNDPRLAEVANSAVLWNTAIVIEGGTHNKVALNKAHYSRADDIEPIFWPAVTGYPAPTALNKLGNANKISVRKYLTQSKEKNHRGSIFPVGDNLTMSLEICLDHASGAVKDVYPSLRQMYPRIDCQLITSCGIRVEATKLVIGEKQFVFRMDGAGTTPPNWAKPPWDPSEIQTVIGSRNGIPVPCAPYEPEGDAAQKRAVWDRLNVVDDEIPLAGDLKFEPGTLQVYRLRNGADAPEQFQTLVDKGCPQKIVVYHPVYRGVALNPQGAQLRPINNQN